jgi:hypothetical protein
MPVSRASDAGRISRPAGFVMPPRPCRREWRSGEGDIDCRFTITITFTPTPGPTPSLRLRTHQLTARREADQLRPPTRPMTCRTGESPNTLASERRVTATLWRGPERRTEPRLKVPNADYVLLERAQAGTRTRARHVDLCRAPTASHRSVSRSAPGRRCRRDSGSGGLTAFQASPGSRSQIELRSGPWPPR